MRVVSPRQGLERKLRELSGPAHSVMPFHVVCLADGRAVEVFPSLSGFSFSKLKYPIVLGHQ